MFQMFRCYPFVAYNMAKGVDNQGQESLTLYFGLKVKAWLRLIRHKGIRVKEWLSSPSGEVGCKLHGHALESISHCFWNCTEVACLSVRHIWTRHCKFVIQRQKLSCGEVMLNIWFSS